MKHPCSVPSVPQAAARMPFLLLLVFCTVCILSAPSVPLASASSPVWFCPLHTVQVSADDGSSCSGECPPVPPLCCPARSPSTTEDGRLISATHYNPLTRLCTLDACDNPLYRKCGVENDGGTDCCPIGTACWVSMDIVYRCSVTRISTAFPIRTFVHQLGGPSPPVNATNAAPHCDPQMDSNGSWMDRCAHQGVCQPTLASFTCTCAAPFSGERCEIFTCPDGFVCAADAVAGIAWNSTDISAVALLCPVGSFCPRNALAPIACVDPSRCPRAGLSHFLPWREPATVCSSDWLSGTGHDGSPYCCPNTHGMYFNSFSLRCDAAACNRVGDLLCMSGDQPNSNFYHVCCPPGRYEYCQVYSSSGSTVHLGICTEQRVPVSHWYEYHAAAESLLALHYRCFEAVIDKPLCLHGGICTPRWVGFHPQPISCQCPPDPAFNNEFCAFSCPAGRVCLTNPPRNSSAYEWQLCPVGSYCSGGGLPPATCPNGTDCSQAGRSSPPLCAAGYYCSSPFAAPVPCAAGTLCLAGSLSPAACPFGHYCSTTATFTPCAPSTYCPSNVTAPLPCTPGYYCAGQQSAPQSCAPGDDCSAARLSAPLACPAGFTCANFTRAPVSCIPGQLCPLRSVAASPCLRGFYCSSPAASLLCPAGRLCDREGLAEPLSCPLGHWCAQGNATRCSPGYYCPAYAIAPVSCRMGSTCTAAGLVAAADCSPGQLCQSPTDSPVPCPAGHFCTGGNWRQPPPECAAGFFCAEGSAEPQECTAGFYCPAAAAAPVACEPGFFCPGCRGSSCSEKGYPRGKLPCSAGLSCASAGLSAPLPCPSNSVCPASAAGLPIPCAAGEAADPLVAQCRPCGSFWHEGHADDVDDPNHTPCAHWTTNAMAVFVTLPLVAFVVAAAAAGYCWHKRRRAAANVKPVVQQRGQMQQQEHLQRAASQNPSAAAAVQVQVRSVLHPPPPPLGPSMLAVDHNQMEGHPQTQPSAPVEDPLQPGWSLAHPPPGQWAPSASSHCSSVAHLPPLLAPPRGVLPPAAPVHNSHWLYSQATYAAGMNMHAASNPAAASVYSGYVPAAVPAEGWREIRDSPPGEPDSAEGQ